MRKTHLLAGCTAVVIFIASFCGWVFHIHNVAGEFVNALAPWSYLQAGWEEYNNLRNQGSAIQRAAFQQPDLLVLFGTSELYNSDPYHCKEVFKNYPTGFSVFPIGKAGTLPLISLQDLASAGKDLHDKKVVISLSPSFFFATQASDQYAGNFSLLHANALAFDTRLSFKTRQNAAQRMLQYPETLKSDPVLKFTLECLADGSGWNRALYYLTWPIGKLKIIIIQTQDNWNTESQIQQKIHSKQALTPTVTKKESVLDWATLTEKAIQNARQNSQSNSFGIYDSEWNSNYAGTIVKQKNSWSDADFIKQMNLSQTWKDLDVLLHGMKDLGVQPLILCVPISGVYYDYLGVSSSARLAFYNRLESAVKSYGVPIIDFADHDMDKFFQRNPGGHLSSEGWVYYDQAMDAFYHNDQR